jgi:hypothetical protein
VEELEWRLHRLRSSLTPEKRNGSSLDVFCGVCGSLGRFIKIVREPKVRHSSVLRMFIGLYSLEIAILSALSLHDTLPAAVSLRKW